MDKMICCFSDFNTRLKVFIKAKTNLNVFLRLPICQLLSASIAFSFGAIYRDNIVTFKGQRCTRETNEVIRNVPVISISISYSISDSALALF